MYLPPMVLHKAIMPAISRRVYSNIRRLESNNVLTGLSVCIGILLNVIELEMIGTIVVWSRNVVGIQERLCM